MDSWELAAVAVKAILYAATLSAAGGVFFLLYSRSLISLAAQRPVRWWVGLCAVVAMGASAARLIMVAGSMGDGFGDAFDGSLLRMVWDAGEARATGLRVVGLLLIGFILIETQRASIVASIGALVAAASFAWIGHSWAAERWLVAVLSVHLIGAAFWLGALMPLLLIVRAGDLHALSLTAKRFGELAVLGVATLLLAGSLLLASFLRHVSDLWHTEYGRLVSGKLAVVAFLLAAAALNKLRFTPRLQARDPAAPAGIVKSIRAELVLGGVVLLITAALTSLVGPPAFE